MSDTQAAVKGRIRDLLRDKGQPYETSGAELEAILHAELASMASMGPIGLTWSDALVALSAGTYSYTLSGESASIVALRLDSQNWQLILVSPEELEAFRTGPNIATGDPTHAAIIEGADQVCKIRLYPTPDKTDAISVLRSVVPTLPTSDSSTIGLGTVGLRALEFMTASHLHPDQQRRAELRESGERFLYTERVRLARQRAGDGFLPAVI